MTTKTRKSSQPTINIERVTPTIAEHWLDECNEGNRSLRQGVVDRYARDISGGNWKLAGDPIRFNGGGTLIDGQHRLAAIIKAKKPVKMVVMRNVPAAAKYHIDTGAKRSFADVLHYMGHKDRNQLAASIRWLVQYESDDILSRRPPTFAEMLNWLEDNERVVESVGFISRYVPYFGLKTVLSAIHFHTRDHMPGEAEAFFTTLRDGENLEKGDPIHTLRIWLERGMVGTKRPLPVITQAIVIKAWNAYIEGRKIQHLRFVPGGTHAESFPKIVSEYP